MPYDEDYDKDSIKYWILPIILKARKSKMEEIQLAIASILAESGTVMSKPIAFEPEN